MRRTSAVLVALIVLVSACGVTDDDTPRALPTGDVPGDLLEPVRVTTSGLAAEAGVFLYFVRQGRLVATQARITEPTLGPVLAQLLAGPGPEGEGAGLRTAIPAGTDLRGLQAQGGQATLDLTGELLAAPRAEQVLAVAQIVYTATGVGSVTRVRFTVDGRPVELPRGDGQLTSGPFQREDFPDLTPA